MPTIRGEKIQFEAADFLTGDSAEVARAIFPHLERLLKSSEQEGQNFTGWMQLPEDTSQLKAVNSWLKAISKKQTVCCVLGIGGSCLGARAVYDFVQPKREVLFFDNIDGHSFEKRLKNLDLKKCHFLAISKSGETSETLFQLAWVFNRLSRQKLKASEHVTVITEEKPSSLMTIAQDLKLRTLPVPFDVGGRFSVLTTVGLAPLMWAGVSGQKLLAGAAWAKKQREMIARLTSYYVRGFESSFWISVFWMYVDDLKTFGLWLEQLWAESLGKARTRSGQAAPRTSTPITCTGATDQHSLLQQFTEGARDKQFLFIRSESSENSSALPKKAIHAKLALTEGKSLGQLLGIESAATKKILDGLRIPTALLTIHQHDAETIGALMFLFEMIVGTIGERLDINAFDQPGVEAVKKVTLGTLGDTRYQDHALKDS